jgi:UDP-2-acetamido-2-deoxy-ribo-hexuluronate aminotransferase
MDAIKAIATSYDIYVIEDAAQSFGATYKQQQSCSLSDIACTSFFPAKPLGAYGDAGACFTQDAALAQLMRQIRDHGQERRYHSVRLGVNGRMDTMQAVVLLAKMEIFDDELQKRQKVAANYHTKLRALENEGLLVLPRVESYNTSSWAQYTLRVANRDDVQTAMKTRGIPTAIHYPVPLFEQPAYLDNNNKCPETLRAVQEVISLPIHPYLRLEEQEEIVVALTEFLSDREEYMRQHNVVGR